MFKIVSNSTKTPSGLQKLQRLSPDAPPKYSRTSLNYPNASRASPTPLNCLIHAKTAKNARKPPRTSQTLPRAAQQHQNCSQPSPKPLHGTLTISKHSSALLSAPVISKYSPEQLKPPDSSKTPPKHTKISPKHSSPLPNSPQNSPTTQNKPKTTQKTHSAGGTSSATRK